MDNAESLIDASFDCAQQLKTIDLQENLLAAVPFPHYYRADSQSPLYSWIVLTDQRLTLISKKLHQRYVLSKIQYLEMSKSMDGYSQINIKSLWRNTIIRGYFGKTEDKLIKTLQLASQFVKTTSSKSSIYNLMLKQGLRLHLTNILMIILLLVLWAIIISLILTI